jgi:hypothetical protein
MKIKQIDKGHELQVYVDNRFFSVNQLNPTTNNHQQASSERPGCDHDASGEKRVKNAVTVSTASSKRFVLALLVQDPVIKFK